MIIKPKSDPFLSDLRSCALCYTKKAAALSNPESLKPDLTGKFVVRPHYLLVNSGNGSSLGDTDWFVSILSNRYGIRRMKIQTVPLLWCSSVKLSKPNARNCRHFIYDGIDRSELKGIILLGSDAVRYFIGNGESPPQKIMLFGRSVRVHDVPYPIFLMPDQETLNSLDPASQTLDNSKKALRARLASFLGVSIENDT